MKKTRHKIVRVEWIDAHGGVRGGWRELSLISKRKAVHALSVGVLLHEASDRVVVCPHFVGNEKGIDLDETDTSGDGEIAIPRSWVRKITVLGYVDQVVVPKRKL